MGGVSKIMLSLLVTARKDSKYLAKFITTFMVNTKDFNNVELLVFIDPTDIWNKELFELFKENIKLVPDNTGIGRGGSHIFYNEVAKEAKGDWLWYLCDDHYLHKDYDEYISNYIKERGLHSDKINVIAPMCDNSGRISHILSRKTYETIGFGNHGNVDSYINETLEFLEVYSGEKQPHIPPQIILTDLGIDKNIMVHSNRIDFNPVEQVALFKSEEMKVKIRADARKLMEVMRI